MKNSCIPELYAKLSEVIPNAEDATLLTDFIASTVGGRPSKRLYALQKDLNAVQKELKVFGPVANKLSPSHIAIISQAEESINLFRRQYKYVESEIKVAYRDGNFDILPRLEKQKEALSVKAKQLVDAVNVLKSGSTTRADLETVTSEVAEFVKESIASNKELHFQKTGQDAAEVVANLLNTLAKIKAGVLTSKDITPKVKSAIHTLIKTTERDIAKDVRELNKARTQVKWKKGRIKRFKRKYNDLTTELTRKKKALKKVEKTIASLEKEDKKVSKRLITKLKTAKHEVATLENKIKHLAKESTDGVTNTQSRKFSLISHIIRVMYKHIAKLRERLGFLKTKVSKGKKEKAILQKILNKIAREEILTAEELTMLELHSKEFLVKNSTNGIKSSAEVLKMALPNVAKHIKPSKSKLSTIPALLSNAFAGGKLAPQVKVMLASMNLSPADLVKVEDTLRTLHTRLKNVVTNPIKSKHGKSVTITEDGEIVFPVKGVKSINMLEAFYEDGYHIDPTTGEHIATLHPIIAEAVKVGQLLAMGSAEAVINNLNAKSDKDLLQDLGLKGKELVQYRIMLNSGKVPEAVLMKEIMPVVMDYLGVRFNRDIDRDIAPLFEKSLQGLILQNLKLNAINNTSSMLKINKVVEEDGTTTITAHEQLDIGNGKSLNILHFKTPSLQLKTAVKEFGYLSEGNSRGKATLTPKKVKETVVNSPIKLSDEMKKEVEKDNKVPWQFSKDTQALVDAYFKDKEKLLDLLGRKKVDLSLPVREVMKIRSVNSKLERELDELVEQYVSLTNNGKNKKIKFFVEHGITKAFRNTIRSSLNVQESKLHREFTHTEAIPKYIEAHSKRKPTDIDLEDIHNEEMFEIFLSQAFDLDPDKNGKLQVFKDIRSIVDIYHKDGVKVVDPEFKWLQDFLDKGKFDMLDLPPEAHALGSEHAIRAVIELWHLNKSKQKGEAKYLTTLSGEADAITSGVILQLLQVGTKQALQMVEKGGVYTQESKDYWEAYTKTLLAEKHGVKKSQIEFNAASLIEAGAYHVNVKNSEAMTVGKHTYPEPFSDLYTTIGLLAKKFKADKPLPEAMALAIEKHLPELTLKQWRSLSKPPVMTFNYGMALENIIKEMALDTLAPLFLKDEGFRQHILEKAKVTDFYTNRKNFLVYDESKDTFVSPKEITPEMLTPEFIEQAGLTIDDRIIDALTEAYKPYLGDAFSKSLEEVFGEITTLRTALTSAEHVIAESFDATLQGRLKQVELADGKITEEAVAKVIEDLEAEGLLHGITIDGVTQPLLKKDNTDTSSDVQSYVSIDPNITGTSTLLDGKHYTYNGGAAGTISIHRIDGRIIIKSIGDKGFINIYDAIIFGSDNNDVQTGANSYQHNTAKFGLGFHTFTNLLGQADTALSNSSATPNSLLTAIEDLAYTPVDGMMHQEVTINGKQRFRDTYTNSEGTMIYEYAESKGRKFLKKKLVQKGSTVEVFEYIGTNESMKKLNQRKAEVNKNKPKDKHTSKVKIADRGTVTNFSGDTADMHRLMDVQIKGKPTLKIGNNIMLTDFFLSDETHGLETPTRSVPTLNKHASKSLVNLLKVGQGNLQNVISNLYKAMELSHQRIANLQGKELHINHLGMVNTLPQLVKTADKLPMASKEELEGVATYFHSIINELDEEVYQKIVVPFMRSTGAYSIDQINNMRTASEFIATMPKNARTKEAQRLIKQIQSIGLGLPSNNERRGSQSQAEVDKDVDKILDILTRNDCL